MVDYSIEFQTLAVQCQWNTVAQWDIFFYGLADYIKDEMFALELPKTLDELIALALRVDARLHNRSHANRHTVFATPLTDWGIPAEDVTPSL